MQSSSGFRPARTSSSRSSSRHCRAVGRIHVLDRVIGRSRTTVRSSDDWRPARPPRSVTPCSGYSDAAVRRSISAGGFNGGAQHPRVGVGRRRAVRIACRTRRWRRVAHWRRVRPERGRTAWRACGLFLTKRGTTTERRSLSDIRRGGIRNGIALRKKRDPSGVLIRPSRATASAAGATAIGAANADHRLQRQPGVQSAGRREKHCVGGHHSLQQRRPRAS